MIRQTAEKRVLRWSLSLSFILFGLILWFSLPLALGLLFGGLMGSLVFYLLILDVSALLRQPEERIQKQSMKGYFRRLSLYGLTILVSLMNPYMAFAGAVLGLLLPRIFIIYYFVLRRNTSGV